MSELTKEDFEKIKWIGEKSLSIANHQSGMRLTITALNFSVMGGLLVYSSSLDEINHSLISLLFYTGFVFAILTHRMSSGHAFAWGVFEKSRNAILPSNENFMGEYKKVEDKYHCLYKRNCFWPFCWVTKLKHYTFWPLVNFLIPVLPAILLLYLKWSAN